MQTTKKFQNQNQDKKQKIDPNDPFAGILSKYTTKCCFLNNSNDDEDDNDSFFEFISDGEDFYECYNCKRAKYEEKKKRRGVLMQRGLWIIFTSVELWKEYFKSELSYVNKRKEKNLIIWTIQYHSQPDNEI
ncbi:hypothetical protein Glove_339g8 [Diversispora epigaea]|uniref:Uncharacterized protein n=1 Tax=Diversispora epigaea TaxID=1348612 RepID=A0A397HHR6_9GLOM|nr:hypothetical protein Glove_339g8 [Diversispora epigaea]